MEKNWRAQLELEEVVVPVPYRYQWWLDHFKSEGGKAQPLTVNERIDFLYQEHARASKHCFGRIALL
jgi:hypothetical protein